MVFEFECVDSLPLLAWCARVESAGVVRVRHGPGVEVRNDAFVEGAWDGEFGAMAFDEAIGLAGSGGRLRGDGVVFASPFHPLEYLYVLAIKDALLVSNSLAFVFAEADDRPDIRYYNYFFDLLKHARRGLPNLPIALPTAGGRRIRPFQVCNLRVDRDLTYHEIPKPLPAAPACYGDYYGELLRSVTGVARNAADPRRKRTYRLVSAISKGYDSTAAAALASKAGGREAVTFVKSAAGHDITDDSGAEIARTLGMTVTEYDRSDVRTLPGFPEAEFFSNPGNLGEVGLRVMEPGLKGSLFTTGRHGEDFLGVTGKCIRRDLREPADTGLPGRGGTEFRIRAGYLNFPALYLGALHSSHLYRITHSQEMRPWTLGVDSYDRPIPRRIAEEAGVPRAFFGQRKMGGPGGLLRGFSDASERDFREFCQAEVPARILQRLNQSRQGERDLWHFRMARIRKEYAAHAMIGPLLELAQLDRWHAMWNSINLYRFHWGFERIRGRYRV
ncbi:MAG TPA: hypothetical protein VML01_04995 [Bryobacterales bacterium]|nr:hypothetical protein [Bryobacterales bacterium]